MNNNHAEPLGMFRPHPKHGHHQIRIILKSADGQSDWATTIDLEAMLSSAPKFLMLELPSKAQLSGVMRQLSNTRAEFTVRLDGDASPATLTDLSHTPLQHWKAIMFGKFAEQPAAIGIIAVAGKVCVALHSQE